MVELTLPTLSISGEDRDRGRQYGEGAAAQIRRSVAYYTEAFGQSADVTWTQVREMAATWIEPSERFAPHLVEEMRGIAEGAGLDLLDIMALNARGEIIRLRSNETDRPAPPTGSEQGDDENPDGCTSFAVLPEASGDGRVYCGQNWDWRHQVRDTVLVMRIERQGAATIIQHVEAGQVGRQGANSAGVALNANGLGGRFTADRVGVPQPLIRRRVLESFHLEQALRVLVHADQDIASNALLTHRDGFAVDLETTPGAHGWLYPTDGVLVHGNHFQGSVPVQLADRYRPYSVSSLYRVPVVARRLRACADHSEPVKVRDAIHSAMSDHFGHPHSVCTHPAPEDDPLKAWSTLLSSCVDLTDGAYFVTAGTPCDHPYERAPWDLYDGPGGTG